MTTFTNVTGVPLSVAVYLATDNYDYNPNTISATALIKPIRQIVLGRRVPKELDFTDVLSVVKSRTGSAIHDSIETAWKNNYQIAMQRLGYPKEVIDRIIINPEPECLKSDSIPVYIEQRSEREIDGFTISGKYDFVAEGRVEDFKSTTVFTWINQTKNDDYRLQGSIYRWLNPHLITQDVMAIEFFFMDWMPGRAAVEPKYPNKPIEQLLIPLISLEDTEVYIRDRLNTIKSMMHKEQSELPLCNDAELWRSDSVFKYYRNPAKRLRSSGNFDTAAEAYAKHAEHGGVGVVVEIPGRVMACKWCKAFPVCEQKDSLIADGSLTLS